ncbi:MAG: hypothetical protein MUF06_16955 [Pirellulaceae bacterium]|nr:hypothetical protein [Pirellulaceae bacterium]
MTQTTHIDIFETCLREGAQKLGDLLKRQTALRFELENAGAEAEAKGYPQFAAVFRAMAAQIGAIIENGKADSATSKRRGRPSKNTATDTVSSAQ